MGAVIILLGVGLVGCTPFEPVGDFVDVFELNGARGCWAFDNNLRQGLSTLRGPRDANTFSAGIVLIGVARPVAHFATAPFRV
ncbi:MAG: hypothetical protein KAX87_02495 [Nitrospira sp.]|nr:hypothetical protein [Nitrospira sp.]